MAKAPLSEETLRYAKGQLTERFAEQQRRGGVNIVREHEKHPAFHANSVPDSKAIEDYVTGVIRKVDVDNATAKEKPAPPEPEQNVGLSQTREDIPGIRDTYSKQDTGTFDWNLRTDKVTARPGARLPARRKKKESWKTKAQRARVAYLKQIPEWKNKLTAAFFSHQTTHARDEALLKVLEDSNRLFGDWRTPREKPLWFGGKTRK